MGDVHWLKQKWCKSRWSRFSAFNPAGTDMFKVQQKKLEQGVKNVHSGVFIVNFEYISHLVLVLLV